MDLDIAEKYSALTETLRNCALYTLDKDGIITTWSAGAQSMKGYSPEEVLGKHLSILYAPEDCERGRPELALKVAAAQGRFEELSWRTRRDGSRIWVHSSLVTLTDENGGIKGFSSVARDLTEFKRDEERFRLVFESAPNAMVLVNQEGNIVLANSQTEKLFGYNRDELIGSPVEILVPKPFLDNHLEVRKDSLVGAQPRVNGASRDFFGSRKDGSQFPVEIGLNPIETGEGTWVLTATDISDRKHAEESKEKFEAQLRHAQKLESLGVLAGGIAHDFNNLLVSILGHAGLALMNLPQVGEERRAVEMIETAAIRAAELTKQLLAYSGKGKFVIQPINLSRLVQEMSHLLGVSISKKIAFITDLPDDLPSIEADAVQMQQVVMNLITNASDSIGDKSGSISVETGTAEVNRDYLSTTYFDEDPPDGAYVYLQVSDTGSGMAPETKRRIFDPFFTTKFAGRGLGLAAVLGIVRGHRGAISLQTEVGHGTTFKVLFPSSQKKAEVPAVQEKEDGKTWRGSGTILVIDDEEGVRIVAKMALERVGFTVLTAEDGRVGLRIAQDCGADLRLVLLDMTMPFMSGEEVFGELVRTKPNLKILLTSGYNELDATSLFAGKRLAGFIQKPYQPMALVHKIRQTLEAVDQPLESEIQKGAAPGVS